MKQSCYPLVIFSCFLAIIMTFSDARSQARDGISTGSTSSQASAEGATSVQAQIQALHSQINQLQAELQAIQPQLDAAMKEQNSLLGSKPETPQGNDSKAWQAYDKAMKEWQAKLNKSQAQANGLRQMMTDKQAEIRAGQKELQQLQANAAVVPPETETVLPPQSIRLPGSRIPGDPRGMPDD